MHETDELEQLTVEDPLEIDKVEALGQEILTVDVGVFEKVRRCNAIEPNSVDSVNKDRLCENRVTTRCEMRVQLVQDAMDKTSELYFDH